MTRPGWGEVTAGEGPGGTWASWLRIGRWAMYKVCVSRSNIFLGSLLFVARNCARDEHGRLMSNWGQEGRRAVVDAFDSGR